MKLRRDKGKGNVPGAKKRGEGMVWPGPQRASSPGPVGVHVVENEKVIDTVRFHIATHFTKTTPC